MKPSKQFLLAKAMPIALLLVATVILDGCSKPGDVGAAPARAGDVWQVDPAADRAATPGAVLAYVNGLHVIVLDGDDLYAGMTLLKTTSRSGGRAIDLGNGLEAVLVPTGPGKMELRFSSGESVSMLKK